MNNALNTIFRIIQAQGKENIPVTWDNLAKTVSSDLTGNALRKKYSRWENSQKAIQVVQPVSQEGTWVAFFDLHCPFHNKKLLNAAMRIVEDIKPIGLILGGDVLDMHSLSSHDKGKIAIPGINLGYEYDETNKVLDQIEDYDWTHKVYIEGNHEARHKKYMSGVDNNKLGSALKSPVEALSLKDRGYDIYANYPNDEYTLGDLTVYHGESFSVHIAYSDLQKIKKSIICGHTHRQQSHSESEIDAYNVGAMADFDSPVFNYAGKIQKKSWSNGLAIITIVEGKAHVEILKWKNNRLVFGGKIYE